jgi:1-acyl-sn-glycerol-3-phosphate acyltransferase
MQSRTIFKTPVVSGFFRFVFIVLTRLRGWRITGEKPTEKKYILIAAPHTSNWDFPSMMAASFVLRLDVHWIGKHTLFPRGPLGMMMRWFGGIAIDRSKSHNTVEQMVSQFNGREDLVVIITPEGTRSKVKEWKAGFYHIAVGAGVPIYMAFVDTKTKVVGMGPAFYPTGDYAVDITSIMGFYADKTGFNPD